MTLNANGSPATHQVAQSRADETLELVQHGVELLTPQVGQKRGGFHQERTFGHLPSGNLT